MSHTHHHEFDGDDGFKTIAGVCGICKLLTRYCDCDSDHPSGDRSWQRIRGYD